MEECYSCRSYKDCGGFEWYSWGEIRFCPWQILWLIENLETLKEGEWPPNPKEEINGTMPISQRAYFEGPCQVAGELEYRLKQTKTDGKLLVAQVRAGHAYRLLGWELRYKLGYEAYAALMYIKGWRRKRQSYVVWKKKRKYAKKST